jgi:ubiquinone/menaquinone biosynthesis C-methylase UbiE
MPLIVQAGPPGPEAPASQDILYTAYDALAPRFDDDRALPDGVANAVRAAALGAAPVARPRVLDLGAGTGRIGWPFVAAGDDYVAVDRSFGMLSAFKRRAADDCGPAPRLVQADGERLPFDDANFDAVLLIQVFGGMRDWRRFMTEVRRVLRPAGALMLGRTIAPRDGVDARMKRQLAAVLAAMGVAPQSANAREDVQQWLEQAAPGSTRMSAATWTAERSPARFIARHRGGARFSALPPDVKTEALRRLGAWAGETFGSLDAASVEPYQFELQLFRFS